jgi:hypothetical protein
VNNGNESGKREWGNVRYQQVMHKIGRSKSKSGRKTSKKSLKRLEKEGGKNG